MSMIRPPLESYRKGIFGENASEDDNSQLMDFISSALQSRGEPSDTELPKPKEAVSPNVEAQSTETLNLGNINNLLSMYGESLSKQKGLDDGRYKSIEDTVNKQREFDLSPQQYEDASKRANTARAIAGIFQAANLGGNGAAFQNIGQNAYESAMSPVAESKYFQDKLRGQAKDQMELGSLQRQNLKEFGGDIENLLQSAKPYEALKIDRDKNDPKSNISIARAMQFVEKMNRLKTQLANEGGSSYQEFNSKIIPDFQRRLGFDDTGKFTPGSANYNQIDALDKEFDAAYNTAKGLEGQKIQRQNIGTRFVITPQQQFEQNKELNKLGDKINASTELNKLWNEVVSMASDPEIRSGFGQKTLQNILSRFSSDKSGLTPKQAKFAAKLQIAVAPERHGLMGSSMTDNEIKEVKEMFPTLDDSLESIGGKVSANSEANIGKLKNYVYQHNLLKTGQPLESDLSDDELLGYGNKQYVKNKSKNPPTPSPVDKAKEYVSAANKVLNDPNESQERKEKAKRVLQKYGAQ